MSRHLLRSVCLGLLLNLAFVPAALAWELVGGMTRADLGLAEKKTGFYLGAQETWPVGRGPLVFIGSAEYQLRRGSQVFNYTSPSYGLRQDWGTVGLHCLQPAGFLAVDLPVGGQRIRLYGGASLLLKMAEAWDEPDGKKGFDLGYEDLGLQAHLGLSVVFGRHFVDARYSAGLQGGVVYRDTRFSKTGKAAGDDLPEDGTKTHLIQVGAGMRF
ncbi:hypothetical protein CSA17_05925 [bacterium DOLJORAL78_65_58]|nr:MAG: hypothetical protein CSB20_07325 [bacterium DOLZORAL124_64_63]PIE75735.1 MAG: hypothetical protein CSA17_05925 [bacterium DOLJORAL78_65_58]